MALGPNNIKISRFFRGFANTLWDIVRNEYPGGGGYPASNGSVSGSWVYIADVSWSGSRVGGSLDGFSAIIGPDPVYYDSTKGHIPGFTFRAAYLNGNDSTMRANARAMFDHAIYPGREHWAKVNALTYFQAHAAVAHIVNPEFQGEGGDTEAPSVPQGLSATAVSDSQINLSWSASTDNVGVTGYRIYRNGSLLTTVESPGYTDIGLSAGTTYTYSVSAYDAGNNASDQSSPASATTEEGSTVEDTLAPSVPQNLVVTDASASEVNLSWSASTDNVGVARYNIFRDGTLIGSSPITSYADRDVSPETGYSYSVQAEDAAGNESARSDIVTVTTPPESSQENILRVGPGQTYATPSEAAANANDGDIVEIDASGDYTDATYWYADNITIRGVGDGRAHIKAPSVISNQKAIWVTAGNNIVIENIEFSEARVPDRNGAGIRAEGTNLTIRNCYFHDNEMGILAGSNSNSEIIIEYSEFSKSGFGDGYSHNIYINEIRKFVLQHSYSHHANIGHIVKSRAHENHILYNRLMDEDSGDSSMIVDIPNGGLTYIIGNIIQQGPNAENAWIITYGTEGTSNPAQELYVVNNTIVNQRTYGGTFLRVVGSPAGKAVNNSFVGGGTLLSGSLQMQNNLELSTGDLVNSDAYDYRLSSGSSAINNGINPGSANGVSLTPIYSYVHPMSREARVSVGNIDVGAYEYGSSPPNDTEPPTSPSNLRVTDISESQIDLSWSLSTDNQGMIRTESCKFSYAGMQ
jgi:chitodextrinase